ncbi:hypothetical protein LUZ61_016860 [Rhynchospora tenuis]|uniref:Uncharacterized protein n=1 Tax=Rhynchospora tenuis TaxID=198213 RepID=A0AAD5Z6C0_9POAL|nr:hypothetical protein LUZ61_016860 [Rhynchospora tenuis]
MTSSYQQTLYQGKTLEITPKNDPINKIVLEDSSDITLDATLSYLSQILMEEDIDEKDILHTNQSALHTMEKPFYDILGQKYPLCFTDPHLSNHKNSAPSSTDHHLDQHDSTCGTLYASEFNKGVAEGIKFLPKLDKLILDLEASKLSLPLLQDEEDLVKLNSDKHGNKKGKGLMECGIKGKKKSNVDLDVLEGRNRKISMSSSKESPENAMFDEVLLNHDNYTEIAKLQEEIQKKASKCSETDQVEIVDVVSLLTSCSHAVFNNDRQSAEDLINQIRKLSSLDGDGTQRMAYLFADALEARLNGTGSEAWRRMAAAKIQIPTSIYLEIAQLFITVCPFPRNSLYYANQTILKLAGKAPKLHIIDFGIGLGFQWPSLIQALSNNNGKSTKLRITGIDFPKPGFRPAELIEETGRRLEAYAESFNVPFEYQGIASNWESVSVDDLKVDKNEVLIVNTMYRFREVGDESVGLDSPRNQVLNLIQRIRPHIFIQGILSIRSFSPFFISRFRQAVPLYSALFEIIDSLIPRENKQRQYIERELFARDILNVLACEGSDWTMRPETYKQWHQRNVRAGFDQIPLDPVLLKECKEKIKTVYDNDIFFIDVDRNWLLQGWSGRIFYGISTWKPKLA